MKIVTLTLNPAFDLHCEAEDLRLYHENFVRPLSCEAGGKGVNLSRALLAGGVDSLCFLLTGKDNEAEFLASLKRDGLTLRSLCVEGRIRENYTFHEKGRPETRISFPGFAVSPAILNKVAEAIGSPELLTFTGSAPKGIGPEEAKGFLRRFREQGTRLVVDSRLFDRRDLGELKPWLVKPNRDEASLYQGRSIQSPADALAFVRSLHESGVENAMVSLGGEGAVLFCSRGAFHAKGPAITPLSTIGAGDSTLAGFLAASVQGLPPEECLRRAVAFGCAACLTEGSRPPQRDAVSAMEKTVSLCALKD